MKDTGAEEGEDTEAVVAVEEVAMVDIISTSMRSLRASRRSPPAPLTRQGVEEYFISPVAVGVQFSNPLLGCPVVVKENHLVIHLNETCSVDDHI